MPIAGVSGTQATKHITVLNTLFSDREITVGITHIFMGNTVAKQSRWW